MYVQNRRACSPKEPGCVPTGASARAACTQATSAEVSLPSFVSYITVLCSVIAAVEKLSFSFFSCLFFLMKTQSGKMIFGAQNSLLGLPPRDFGWLMWDVSVTHGCVTVTVTSKEVTWVTYDVQHVLLRLRSNFGSSKRTKTCKSSRINSSSGFLPLFSLFIVLPI